MKDGLSIVILCRNEERHLLRLLPIIRNENKFNGPIYVIDSLSTDGSRLVAEKYGCVWIEREFVSQGDTIAWFLSVYKALCDWVIRIDADEIIPSSFLKDVEKIIGRYPRSAGFSVERRINHRGKELRFGGTIVDIVRIFHIDRVEIDSRLMDEHLVASPPYNFVKSRLVITDFSLISVDAFLMKQVAYSRREMISVMSYDWGGKNNISRRIYYYSPVFFRGFLLFIYRYFFRLGFLDGTAGLKFLLMNTLVYRLMVDYQIYEKKRESDSA